MVAEKMYQSFSNKKIFNAEEGLYFNTSNIFEVVGNSSIP
jgi:hypothetical protein